MLHLLRVGLVVMALLIAAQPAGAAFKAAASSVGGALGGLLNKKAGDPPVSGVRTGDDPHGGS